MTERKNPVLSLAVTALTIVGAVATVFSCLIAFIVLVNPTAAQRVIIEFYNPITPTPQVVLITQPAPTLPPLPTYTPYPSNVPVPTNTAIPTASATVFVPPANGILFQDNFDKGINPEWQQSSGNWITANGRLTIVFQDYKFMWLYLDAPQWQNYRVEANIDRPNGQVLIAVRNQSLAYKIGFYPNKNCWTYLDSADPDCIVGESQQFASENFNIELDVNNNEYVALIDGVEAQRITLNGQTKGGVSIGIYCQQGFECPSIDNFKVTYLP